MMDDAVPWSGGDCPVAPDQMVEVEFRDFIRGIGRAGQFEWSHDNLLSDIIWYKVRENAAD